MAYFWADDFINFLENEKILSFKLSNFWELLTNEQFLNLVESYENKGKFNANTSEGLIKLYNIFYKQRIKIRDSAFSCSNKDILECLRYYMRFFEKNKTTLKFKAIPVNSTPQKIDHLSINPKQEIENNVKNTSKFANTLERLKNIAKEKQVLKSDENIPEQVNNKVDSPVDVPKVEVEEENREDVKENEEKPKSQENIFYDKFYNYLLEKYNSEDEALNLLFGFKLCKIYNKRYNSMSPYKKINYKKDVEFQEFNEDNFGIPKKSLFDYLAFKKILSENKEKENTEQTDIVKSKQEIGILEIGNTDNNIENAKTEIEEVKTENIENEAEPVETENKPVEIVEENVEAIEPIETENKSVEIVEERNESTESVETEIESAEIVEEKVEATGAVETENKPVEIVEEKVEATEPVETEIEEVREDVSDKFCLQDVDETFLNKCESLLPTKLYFYGEIIEVKNWKELYISVARLFAKHFHDLLYSECSAGKGLLHSSILDIALVGGNLREPVQICDNLFLTTFERFNSKVKIYLQKIIKIAEICKADLTQIIIVT